MFRYAQWNFEEGWHLTPDHTLVEHLWFPEVISYWIHWVWLGPRLEHRHSSDVNPWIYLTTYLLPTTYYLLPTYYLRTT
jgi:hypothetical protein